MESPQKNNSNTGILVAVLCLVIGVVLGAVVVNTKSIAPSQEGAAIKSSTTQTATTGKTMYTPAQLEAQSKLKTRLVFQNTPEEVATAFGLDMKTFTKRAPDAKVRAVFDQMFGGNPTNTPYYEECAGQLSYYGDFYEVGSGGVHGYYWTTANCDWGF